MKVYSTKYALTRGIEEVEGETVDPYPDMFRYMTAGKYVQYLNGNEWHRTREEAVIRADQMRLDKIESLRKSIAKLKALRFARFDDD